MKATLFLRALSALAVTVAVSASIAMAGQSFKTVETGKGAVLADERGMSLYIFDKDAAGKSNCNGPCAGNWPPVMADAYAKADGRYSIITRDDGSKQWAVDGKPVYRWKNDRKPGDVSGDGFNGVWHLAKP